MQPDAPSRDEVRAVSGWRRWLFVALGSFFVGLAALGVALPGLPTTPFLLVASYFFVRSSPRLHAWLLSTKTFGPLLRDWQRHRGIRRGPKLVATVMCTVMIAISVVFGGLPWAARILVAMAGAYGIWFVWHLPDVPPGDTS